MIRPTSVVACLAAPAAAQDCATVPVEPGSAVEVPGEPPACYELAAEDGQRARVQVIDGPDALFSVDGLVERQEDYAFVAEGGPVRVRVTSQEGAPFVLRLSVTEAGATGAWRIEEGEGRVSGLAWIGEPGGPSVALSCSADSDAVGLVYDGFGTVALTRAGPDGASGVIEVERGDEVRRHPVTLRRVDGFDPYWEVVGGLDAALLDDFAAGSVMRLLDAEGSSAGRVGLEGSMRLRDAIARRCGL